MKSAGNLYLDQFYGTKEAGSLTLSPGSTTGLSITYAVKTLKNYFCDARNAYRLHVKSSSFKVHIIISKLIETYLCPEIESFVNHLFDCISN